MNNMSFRKPFDRIIHTEGVVIPAVLKSGCRVFVVAGDVRQTVDGGIDPDESDKIITVYDVETSLIQKTQIDNFLEALEPISAKKAEEIVNCPFVVGREYDMLSDDNMNYHVKVLEKRDDGTVLVQVDGVEEPVMLPQEMAQQWIDNVNSNQEPTTEDIINALFSESEKETARVFSQSKPKEENVKIPNKDGDDWKSWLSGIGCFVLFVLLITTCSYNSYKSGRERRERKEFIADSIAKRERYVKDSIDSVRSSPEYKAYMDSLHIVQEKKRENEEKSTVVLVCAGDSVYHFMTQCFVISNIGKIKAMSEYDAKKAGLQECYDCVRDLDGYVHEEDISEYIRENFDKWDIIDLFDITSDDL